MTPHMNKLTPAGLKKWARENKALAETVCRARAYAELERERVDAIAREVFAGFEIVDEDGERITDPARLYLSDDDCTDYYAALDTAHRAHGFDGPEGHCPALIAEDLQRQAEDVLLGSLGEFVGINGRDFSRSLDTRAKALDVALTCCLGKLV